MRYRYPFPATTSLRRSLSILGILACVTLFLIGSNIVNFHQPCLNRSFYSTSGQSNTSMNFTNGGSGSAFSSSARASRSGSDSSSTHDLFIPESESKFPVETKSYIFVREQSLIARLASDSNTSKASIDLLLNIRKLTIFAAHELNNAVGCRNNVDTCRADGGSKWWTNPLNTLALKTHSYPPAHADHDLTFIAEPDGIPVFVRIRQFNITDNSWVDKPELVIKGKFLRLDGEEVSKPKVIETLNSTSSNNPYASDDAYDPQLITWPRNKSFSVGDYVDFKNIQMYKISPGSKNRSAVERYCGSALKMLVMVSSAPKHFEQRRVIRETYGSEGNLKSKSVRLVFLFGVVSDASLQAFLEEEANHHDDLIQADFTDSYHNLTLSHLSMYNWLQVTCEDHDLPKYVLKADDDFFLNIDLALRVAYGNPDFQLMGVAYCGTRPIRNLAYMTKYYTPRYMYMADVYVGYLSGVAYIFRTDIIPKILKLSLTTPIIHMDDVYITGLIARQLNIPPMGSQLFTYGRSEPDACSMKKMVSSYVLSVDDMRTQWNAWIKPIPENCSLTYIDDLIKINPFRQQDVVACILE